MIPVDPWNLTPGEALELQRRRARWSQKDLAANLGVALDRVRRWENDDCIRGAPAPKVSRLELHEWCWLVRRRRRVTLRQLSAATGLAVTWLHRAEHGDIPPERAGALPAYWRKVGALPKVLPC